ncbi:Wadjet anti-phage system protein JetD domain-containing protein [Acidithiobacillus sp. M4-SHS-6]|uniref:Wadjet anti-phage system protein JetD domain-containing protein n=1 Tax=Acidithiobacillus sp. M4-SHS-6 TaxID=3383024 RepID=UPI0039BEB129
MTWTTSAELKIQVQKLWDRGVLLASLCEKESDGESLFPLRLTLKGPSSRELSERFQEVRDWIGQLSVATDLYRIEWRSVKHHVLGANEIPAAIWIDKLSDALGLIGKRRAAEQFAALVELTRDKQSELLPWLTKRPLRALELVNDWPRLLEVIGWLLEHPRPAIYLRQLDLPGVHSKLIEGHRGVLAELLDLVMPENSIDGTHTGIGGFCRRYGFLDKPSRVRFRMLDANVRLLSREADQDITLTQSAFASLELPISKVFITENEINFLAFPDVSNALVVFGAGYGFDHLKAVPWLHEKKIYYWGDIDTHGFAILNQLRGFLPHVVSLLMDQQTLLAHRALWGSEARPETGTLTRLTSEESAVYDQLRQNHWGEGIRLEQERIGFDFLRDALRRC